MSPPFPTTEHQAATGPGSFTCAEEHPHGGRAEVSHTSQLLPGDKTLWTIQD